jgi:multiple antibiotic resistance protein
MVDLSSFAKTFISLVAIVNPPGAIPTFLTITGRASSEEKHRMAGHAPIAVGCLLVGGVLAGQQVLGFFGITMASFRVAGGILLLLMAIAMLHGQAGGGARTSEEDQAASDRAGIAVVPLALPLLAGPGSISTVVLYSQQCGNWGDKLLLIAASLLVAVAVWVNLRLASRIAAKIGVTGIRVFTRLMGLFLAAIAVEFMVDGLMELLPGLARP